MLNPFRRRLPPFAIVSLPRSGSTALYRVLGSASRVRIECEPDFEDAWQSKPALERYCRYMFWFANGMKHVWDPNGWPFVNKSHQSSPEVLAGSERWIGVNASLLGCVHKVVRLKRRNQLARVLSDLLGQQTHLWGHDPKRPHSRREAIDYRNAIRQQKLRPIDERTVEWYLENGLKWGGRIVSRQAEQKVMTVYYEDLFGPELDIETRMDRVAEIGDWLGIPVPVDNPGVRAIMQPESKFNDAELYASIPNYQDIIDRFGPL